MLAAERKHLVAAPAVVTEFEGTADRITGQQLKKTFQTAYIAGKSGRKLPEDNPEFVSKQKGTVKDG